MKLMGWNSKDIGVDLGTANIIITIKGKGIVLNEPSVVAIDKNNGTILATGAEAKEMLGRTPNDIAAIRPLKDGVIADFTATKLLLKKIMDKVCKKYNAVRPRVIVGVPSGITEVEERAVEETIIRAGAKEVYLIEEPMAAAIGAGIEIEQPSGNIIVDIGGGTTEVAVISLGGIVLSNSIRIAGDELNEDIINYVKRELNLAIGETTAENIKKELGCALPLMSQMSMKIKGRDLATGLPATEIITSGQVEEAIKDSIAQIVEVVKLTLEKTQETAHQANAYRQYTIPSDFHGKTILPQERSEPERLQVSPIFSSPSLLFAFLILFHFLLFFQIQRNDDRRADDL